MATQGIVSVREDKEVVMKVVAGINGYNAPKVAKELKSRWPVTPQEAYDIAISNNFGVIEDLVVVTLGENFFKEDEDLDPRYQETFKNPNFNPRWERGTAAYVEIVDVRKMTQDAARQSSEIQE